jgi:transcription initiation factor IIF auxiliary subunit
MSINRILRGLEKEFKVANEKGDYRIAHKLFEQILPMTETPKYDEKVADFLHKLRDDKILTQTQFISYRARQVQYSIDIVKVKNDKYKSSNYKKES